MAYALTSKTNFDRRPERSFLILRSLASGEKTVCLAIAHTFFSDRILLGRLLAVVLLIFQTKIFLFGSLGAILTELAGRRFSLNKSLQKSGVLGLNGFFVGLAAATFLGGYSAPLVAVLMLSLMTFMIVVASHRLMKTWDLPLLVMPYCISFWMMQLLSQESHVFKLTVGVQPLLNDSHDLLKITYGTLISFSQIFFSANWMVGSAIAVILMALEPRRIADIAASALFPNLVVYLCLGHHWSIHSGLTAFSGVLLFHAHRAGFLSISHAKLWVFIGMSGLFEVIALKISELHGIFALSASYIAIYWLAKLNEEVRQGKVEKNPVVMTW